MTAHPHPLFGRNWSLWLGGLGGGGGARERGAGGCRPPFT